jgi:hypothetical protein
VPRSHSDDALFYRTKEVVDVVYRYRPDRAFWPELRPSDERRLRALISGEQDFVTLPVADRILTQIGLHIWMLPEPRHVMQTDDGLTLR